MSEVLPSANGRFSPSLLSTNWLCSPSPSTSLITGASIPSRHYLLMNHETGIITHSLTPHSSVYYHRPFVIAFIPIVSLPVHITSFSIVVSLYDRPSLLYNPPSFVQPLPYPLLCTAPTFFVRLPSLLHTSIVFYDRELDTTHVCTLVTFVLISVYMN